MSRSQITNRGSQIGLWCLLALAGSGCRGPVRIDYEAVVGRPVDPAREPFQEVPLRRFALSPRRTLERQLFERVAQAVELSNRFLDSHDNVHFPPGWRFRAAEDGRLFLESGAGEGFRIRIHVTCWGTLISEMGFSAQESVDGFSVGALSDVRGRPTDVTIANTLFFTLDGKWRPVEMIAALLLHEMTHTLQVRAQGQTSYWLEYYLRSTLLMQGGGVGHDLEKVPYRVETEFWRWLERRRERGDR